MTAVIIIVILVLGVTLAVFLVHGWFELTNGIGFIPLPTKLLGQIVAALDLKPDETLIDLGCGDGRVLRAAKRVQPAVTAIGVENNPLVALLARFWGPAAQITRGDLFKLDLADTDAVFLYLHPSINRRVAEKLRRELAPGVRVASLQFELPGWMPERVIELDGPAHANRLFVYRHPAGE